MNPTTLSASSSSYSVPQLWSEGTSSSTEEKSESSKEEKTECVWVKYFERKLDERYRKEVKQKKWEALPLLELVGKEGMEVDRRLWKLITTSDLFLRKLSKVVGEDLLIKEREAVYNPILEGLGIGTALAEGWTLLVDTSTGVKEKLGSKYKPEQLDTYRAFHKLLVRHHLFFKGDTDSSTLNRLHTFKILVDGVDPAIRALFYKSVRLLEQEVAMFLSKEYLQKNLVERNKLLRKCLNPCLQLENAVFHYPHDSLVCRRIGEIGDFTAPLRSLTGGFGESIIFSATDLKVEGINVFDSHDFSLISPPKAPEIELSSLERYFILLKVWLEKIYQAECTAKGDWDVDVQAAFMTLATFSAIGNSSKEMYRWVIDLKRKQGIDLITPGVYGGQEAIDPIGLVDSADEISEREGRQEVWNTLIVRHVSAAPLLQLLSIEMRHKVWDLMQPGLGSHIGRPSENKRFSYSFKGVEKGYDIFKSEDKDRVICKADFPWSVADAKGRELFSCTVHASFKVCPAEGYAIEAVELQFAQLKPHQDAPMAEFLQFSCILEEWQRTAGAENKHIR